MRAVTQICSQNAFGAENGTLFYAQFGTNVIPAGIYYRKREILTIFV